MRHDPYFLAALGMVAASIIVIVFEASNIISTSAGWVLLIILALLAVTFGIILPHFEKHIFQSALKESGVDVEKMKKDWEKDHEQHDTDTQ